MSALARKTVLGLALAVSLGFAVAPALGAPPSGGCVVAATTTCTFSYTGAPEAWVVPAGVTSAVFDVWGAQGGSCPPTTCTEDGISNTGNSGGKGGHVQATVALTPNVTLNMRVGGAGQDGAFFTFGASGTATIAGGFNGGGTNSYTCGECIFGLGGAGGGSSDVRTSGDALTDRLLVAGGGGGAGAGYHDGNSPGNGGNSATAANSVGSPLVTCTGGGAGLLGGPGAAGSCTCPIVSCTSGSGSPGAALGLDGGGNGGLNRRVGAGGGGYFGGGAGAAAYGGSIAPEFAFSGGGGGSDRVDPSATNVTVTDGVRTGNGIITVTYANPTAVTLASASATRTVRGVLIRWRTGTEADLLGFHVYRSRGHSWQRITRSLVVAKGSVSGDSYRYVDKTARRGVANRYRVKAVNRDGTATWFGAVGVT